MRHVRTALFLFILFTGMAGIGYAQVDRGELQKNLAPVTFYNNEGPQARVETREQIRQLGAVLGQAIRALQIRTGAANRYFVIHSVSVPDGDKLDADIFGLGSNAGVDHIRNLRTIIQGYLQEAYSYTAGDAALLAEYITIYNAVYRGNWSYFSGRFKKPVLDNLNRDYAGLAVRYQEWPGKTLMLIPLNTGGLSSINTSAVSDSSVVERMKTESDRGVPQRQGMVDLKEREAAQAEREAAARRDAARTEADAIARDRQRLEEEQRQTARDRQQIEKDKASGDISKEEAARREAELARREADADKKSEQMDQRENDLAAQRQEAAKQEQFAEQKREEARQDRESIARDQQAMLEQGSPPQASIQGVISLVIERQNAALGRLVSFDPATGRELRRSGLDTVYVRTLTIINNKVLAIAGENKGNGAVRLIEINPVSLEMTKQGDDDIHPGSLVWVIGGDLYALAANRDGTLNLGRFNTDLILQARSKISIHPNAMVSMQQGLILTQRADGKAAILNPRDLTEK
jgi:flagellar biosynthesis GTPase FlhF